MHRGWPAAIVLATALSCANPVAALAATARASGAVTLYGGPGYGYAPVGRLVGNEIVRLDQCTASGRWCHVLGAAKSGWALGSYLIGSAAKLAATPYRPLVNPFPDPLRHFLDPD
jgi:uncharacterized protein YraI